MNSVRVSGKDPKPPHYIVVSSTEGESVTYKRFSFILPDFSPGTNRADSIRNAVETLKAALGNRLVLWINGTRAVAIIYAENFEEANEVYQKCLKIIQ